MPDPRHRILLCFWPDSPLSDLSTFLYLFCGGGRKEERKGGDHVADVAGRTAGLSRGPSSFQSCCLLNGHCFDTRDRDAGWSDRKKDGLYTVEGIKKHRLLQSVLNKEKWDKNHPTLAVLQYCPDVRTV